MASGLAKGSSKNWTSPTDRPIRGLSCCAQGGSDHSPLLPQERARIVRLRVAIIGDSLGMQLYSAWKLRLPNQSLQLTWLPVLFHQKRDVKTLLNMTVGSADLVVFALGSWYQQKMSKHKHREYSSELDRTATSSFRNGEVLADSYAKLRRESKLVYLDDFERDLKQLRMGIYELVWDYQHILKRTVPTIVWRSIPAQHYSSSGEYEGKVLEECAQIVDQKKARMRDTAAHKVLGDLFSKSFVHLVDIWKMGASRPDLHPMLKEDSSWVDCTHYCNPSVVTWDWLTKIAKTTLAAQGVRQR